MREISVITKRGAILDGAIFRNESKRVKSVCIAITGIHGNFYSNPFYYNIGETLSQNGIDFIYAQTNDAFSKVGIINASSGKKEIIGSYNERFSYTDEDIEAYLNFARNEGYENVVLAGRSLGANKVIYYLSRHRDDSFVKKFFLLSPANLAHMTSSVSEEEKRFIKQAVDSGRGEKALPFAFVGWVECIALTAHDWCFSGLLDNVFTDANADFSQCARITHSGALPIGTFDTFTDGDASKFLRNINDHIPSSAQNSLIFIEKTGHTYQQKHQEVADKISAQILSWRP